MLLFLKIFFLFKIRTKRKPNVLVHQINRLDTCKNEKYCIINAEHPKETKMGEMGKKPRVGIISPSNKELFEM